MRPPDLDTLRDDLFNFHSALEEPGARASLVEAALPRLLETLALIPDTAAGGELLELGASPYFLTLCLRRLCRVPVRLGNYFGSGGGKVEDRLVHRASGETLVFESDLFDIERDIFPYPDESLDGVIFSELIEHLCTNPVWALSEIHRVLRPGGWVVVTTPNALSLERFATFLRGGSQMVDRFSPAFGCGARHNREYHDGELRELLEGTGFVVEAVSLRDLTPPSPRDRRQRALWRGFLSLYSRLPREEHIFLRARRGARFRWHFPPSLFTNMRLYVLVRHPWVEMGINDSIQCTLGWSALEPAPGGDREVCWLEGEGQAFITTADRPSRFGVEVFAPAVDGARSARLKLLVWHRWYGHIAPHEVYLDTAVDVPRGSWQRLELPLTRVPPPRDEAEVRLAVEETGDPALAGAGARQRSAAVRRLWLA